MNIKSVLENLRILRDDLSVNIKTETVYLLEMKEANRPEDELECQRNLINNLKYRFNGLVKAIQGIHDYIDGV